MTALQFHQFICRSDNYAVLVHDPASGATVSIDAPDADAIINALDAKGWTLTDIFTTHHHGDHVEGNLALKQRFQCAITGPKAEAGKIPGIDRRLGGGDAFTWVGHDVRIFDCPGHTLGHIAYHMPDDTVLFAADTLFSLGCGRVFEGTMAEMHHSVNQFRDLPPETLLHCGHEYTQSNARFALSVEPGNAALQARAKEVDRLRVDGKMTCPTRIGDELETNPFLRCASAEIRRILNLAQASDEEVFAALRRAKDSFR
ncbi:hydroxyacylglutathione hydrolase [Aestuariivirga sp.]|uniref:hydroxyacylglutathione hydrolase n=1 Tax=Aestuariivirga sp. TaxID=2650926 RepID=UPI0039E49DDA